MLGYHVLATESVTQVCLKFVEHCWGTRTNSFRALCPWTCGCWDWKIPAAGFFADASFGCPSVCKAFSKNARIGYLLQHGLKDDCDDSSPSAFLRSAKDQSLSNYIEGFLGYGFALPNAMDAVMDQVDKTVK